ncbi:hypothetical protein QFC24_002674 [Naganishia onofrii]|uniref:Uncharacterized protein n=1 Tax=Naganishia onofrii TaxID=1851511 RepID=A0ACC2XPA4_9TREE|nr:hypothetical protein QFC24_002674 [Naganishia onofrii]
MSAPPFVTNLLQGDPLPCIIPGHIQAKKGFHPDAASQIANALFHPAVEVACHLLNGDLYSAHFLVRKMQNDPWGILHRYEGDLCNSKAWTNGIDEEILAKCPLYQGNHQSKQPAHASAFKLIDQVGLARRSLQPSFLRKQYGDKNIKWPESAPTEDELVAEQKRLHDQADGSAGEIDGKCWEEICWLANFLGEKYGWDQNTEGTKGYTESTEEQKEISRKMVGGGEGIRKF